MKKIDYYTGEYRSDVIKIQQVLESKGYDATMSDCETLWGRYSESMYADWMSLPDEDEQIFDCISSYINN